MNFTVNHNSTSFLSIHVGRFRRRFRFPRVPRDRRVKPRHDTAIELALSILRFGRSSASPPTTTIGR